MSRTAIAAASPEFKRINRAMLCGGFAAFALLYCVQPLMPMLAQQFALTPSASSWALSISTLALAVSLLASSALSDRIGRKNIMALAMVAAALLTVLCAFAQSYAQLLLMRAALGLALGGMPAVAMAYLSEEIEAPSLGLSIGLYIGGSAFGGMAGRIVAATASDLWSWRVALAVMGVLGLAAAWEFWRSLPRSRNFRPGHPGWDALLAGIRGHLGDGGLPWMFCLAFLLMGCFVGMSNYIGYRLLAAPFGLRQSAVGALAALYLLGIFASVWVGRLSDRLGRRRVLWIVMSAMLAGLLLTLSNALLVIVAGMALFTFGFFASHSVTSSWVGRRARAPQALASALYLFFYYVGSSVIGSFSGLAWGSGGWQAVVLVLACTLGVAFLIALRLRGLAPLGVPGTA